MFVTISVARWRSSETWPASLPKTRTARCTSHWEISGEMLHLGEIISAMSLCWRVKKTMFIRVCTNNTPILWWRMQWRAKHTSVKTASQLYCIYNVCMISAHLSPVITTERLQTLTSGAQWCYFVRVVNAPVWDQKSNEFFCSFNIS